MSVGSGSIWSTEEMEIVRAMYPSSPWPDIRAKLRGRTEKGISAAARKIGITRIRVPYGTNMSPAKQASVARANAKRSAQRAKIQAERKHHVSRGEKQAKARLKAALSGAEHHAAQARMRDAKQQPCVPGTYRARNGVTLAMPGQAHLYSERQE